MIHSGARARPQTSSEPPTFLVNVLLAFMFLQPFLTFLNEPISDIFKHLFLRGVTVGLFAYTFLYRSSHFGLFLPSDRKLLLLLGVYFLSLFIPSFFAVLSGKAFIGRTLFSLSTAPLMMSCLFLYAYWIKGADLVLKLVRALIYSIVAVSIFGILQIFFNLATGGAISVRLTSVFHDPNIFGRSLLVGIFFLIPGLIFNSEKLFPRRKTILFVLLFGANLIFTYSRSGYLTMMIGLVICGFFVQNAVFRLRLVAISIGSGALLFLYYSTQRGAGMDMFVDHSNFNRLLLMIGGWEIFKENPLIGIGYTNFDSYYARTFLYETLQVDLAPYQMVGFTTSMHNWIIEVLVEQGISGLLVFLSLFGMVTLFLFKELQKDADPVYKQLVSGGLMALYVFLFQGLFYHTFVSQYYFWVVCSLIYVVVRNRKHFTRKISKDCALNPQMAN